MLSDCRATSCGACRKSSEVLCGSRHHRLEQLELNAPDGIAAHLRRDDYREPRSSKGELLNRLGSSPAQTTHMLRDLGWPSRGCRSFGHMVRLAMHIIARPLPQGAPQSFGAGALDVPLRNNGHYMTNTHSTDHKRTFCSLTTMPLPCNRQTPRKAGARISLERLTCFKLHMHRSRLYWMQRDVRQPQANAQCVGAPTAHEPNQRQNAPWTFGWAHWPHKWRQEPMLAKGDLLSRHKESWPGTSASLAPYTDAKDHWTTSTPPEPYKNATPAVAYE